MKSKWSAGTGGIFCKTWTVSYNRTQHAPGYVELFMQVHAVYVAAEVRGSNWGGCTAFLLVAPGGHANST